MSRAATKAYDSIRSSIVSGNFEPGSRLKEEELVSRFEVSRTPIREALRRLHQEGLVDFVPNQGTYVKAWTAKDLEDIYSLRSVLEGFAARTAAECMSAADIAQLKQLAGTMESAVGSRIEGFEETLARANIEFHNIILESAGNDRLAAMVRQVIEIPLTVRTFRHYSEEDLSRSMQHHRDLISALESRNGEWAAGVMHSHVFAAYHTLRQHASQDGLEDAPIAAE